MSQFDFDLKDLTNSSRSYNKVADQILKHTPSDLKTSRMAQGSERPFNLTMFSLSTMLMNIPAHDAPEDILGRFESVMSGTVGALLPLFKDNPHLANLIPEDILARLSTMNPDFDLDLSRGGTGGGGGTVGGGGGSDTGTGGDTAAGGPVTEAAGWERMWAVVKAQFPTARLTSARRSGSGGSYHNSGRAIDIGGPSPVPQSARNWGSGGSSALVMDEVFTFLLNNYKSVTKELIYSPAADRNIKNGRTMRYSASVIASHWNHVHWAV